MLVVQKYGGSSVATLEPIRAVAQRVLDRQRSGDQVVVVVSAMSGETNRLIEVANQLHRLGHEQQSSAVARETGWVGPAKRDDPEFERELSQLVSTGEVQSAVLLAMGVLSKMIKAPVTGSAKIGLRDTSLAS